MMKVITQSPYQFKEIWRSLFTGPVGARAIFYVIEEGGLEARFSDGVVIYVMKVAMEDLRSYRIGPAHENIEFMPESAEMPDPNMVYDKEVVFEGFKKEFMPKGIQVQAFID